MALLRHGCLAAALLAALAAPATAAPPEVLLKPDRVVLGTTTEVQIAVVTSDPRKLHAHASTGTLSPGRRLGPDEVRFTYTPPSVRYPHTAILLFWVDRGADPPEMAVVRLPLLGRTDLEASTEPRADVRVEVGDRTFGPRRADARGVAVVPIEVPPGATEAKVLSVVGGVSKTVLTPLQLPPTNRLAVVAGPSPLPRTGGWAWLVSADKIDYQALQIDASGGAAGRTTSMSDRALIALHPAADSQVMSVAFRIAGAPEDRASLELAIEDPPFARPHALSGLQLTPGALLGGTYAGDRHLSILGAVALEVSFPPFGTAFAAGLALEGNTMALSAQLQGLGQLDARLLAFSPLAVARYQVFTLGAAAFHVRAGIGPVLYVHQLSSDFEPAWSERGVTLGAFAGGQISYRVGTLDLLLEARWAHAHVVHEGQLDANMGGLVIGLGARVSR